MPGRAGVQRVQDDTSRLVLFLEVMIAKRFPSGDAS
jgi:hypothetical protein